MSTSHGVIQGYNGVAVVDEKHQIIVNAEAHGEGQEAHLLQPMLESAREELKAANIAQDIFQQTKVIADAGYHSNVSVSYTQENGIDAYIADRSHRQRDPAFLDYDLAEKNGLRVLHLHTEAKAWNFRSRAAFFAFCAVGFVEWTRRLPPAERPAFINDVLDRYQPFAADRPGEVNTSSSIRWMSGLRRPR